MKPTIARTILVIVASMFIVGTVPNAQARHDHQCSNASLQGTYGFYNTGSEVPAGTPRTVVGLAIFDGEGNWFNISTINDNGTVTHVTVPGLTYTVNSDCTGTWFTAGGTEFAAIVVLDGGKELFGIGTLPTRVLYGVFKKLPDDEDKD